MKLSMKALAAIRREQMLPPGTAVVVGLSGGADSVALLHLLLSLRKELSLSAVTAVHVNHGLRGEEAMRDQQFAERLCEQWQVPLTVHRCDVAALAEQQHCGTEEAGRMVRYRLLEQAADAFSSCRIATAHTASDNVETVLLHLCRGSGLHGMAGIPPVRGRVIRPLIDCTRAEIEAYCREHGLSYVADSTNADLSYARNRVRHRIVPELQAINPQAEAAIARMIRRAGEWDRTVTQQAQALLDKARRGADTYDRAVLRCAEAVVLETALRLLLGSCGEQRGSEVQICRAVSLLEHGGTMTVSGARQLTVDTDTVRLAAPSAEIPPFRFELPTDEATWSIGEDCWRLHRLTRREYEQKLNISKFMFANALDYDKICGSLYVRQRLPGDAFHPGGRGCGKSLKKLLNEAAVPTAERNAIPILCDAEGIVLVAGFGCDERVRITETTTSVLWMEKTEVENNGFDVR